MPVGLTDLGAPVAGRRLGGLYPTLDSAIKADDHQARAFFLRARAKELAGKSEAALTITTWPAAQPSPPQDLASGEAHLYRGI